MLIQSSSKSQLASSELPRGAHRGERPTAVFFGLDWGAVSVFKEYLEKWCVTNIRESSATPRSSVLQPSTGSLDNTG